jgi:hypothetical protein
MKSWQDISTALSFPKGIRRQAVLAAAVFAGEQIQNPTLKSKNRI